MAKSKREKRTKKSGGIPVIAKLVGSVGHRILLVVVIVIVFYYAITRAYSFGYSVFLDQSTGAGAGTDVIVSVEEDMTDRELGDLLYKKGLIRDPQIFSIQIKLYTSKSYAIRPGVYKLNTAQTSREMIEAMAETLPAAENETQVLGLKETVPETPSQAEEPEGGETTDGT